MLVNYLLSLEKLRNGITLKMNFTFCENTYFAFMHGKKSLKQMDMSPSITFKS